MHRSEILDAGFRPGHGLGFDCLAKLLSQHRGTAEDVQLNHWDGAGRMSQIESFRATTEEPVFAGDAGSVAGALN